MAGETSTTVDVSGAERKMAALKSGMKDAKRDFINRMISEGERKMKQLIPVKTGNLRNSVSSGVLSDGTGAVTASAGYARMVNDGTRAHTIVPVGAKALAFVPAGSGGVVFSKVVHHPGTKGVKFAEGTRGYLDEIKVRVVESIIKAMTGGV